MLSSNPSHASSAIWIRAPAIVLAEAERISTSRLVTLYDLYDLYEERIEDYAENPPGADWDGVYVALRK